MLDSTGYSAEHRSQPMGCRQRGADAFFDSFCSIGYMTDLGWGLNSVCHIGWFLAFLNFLLVIERERRKKPPVPTRVLSIYFKHIPSRVIDLESQDIFSELI